MRHRFSLALVPALALLAAAPAGARPGAPPGYFHGCGALAVPDHPWRSVVPGAPHEWGDHWIVSWTGSHGSCGFARRSMRAAIEHPPADAAPFRGGHCALTTRRGHEAITPFARILCVLPRRTRKRTYQVDVRAMVDPDPTFIHPGDPPS